MRSAVPGAPPQRTSRAPADACFHAPRSCSRLGLTPIAYLWERDQKELLGEMVAAQMESVLVKVAGAG